MSPDLTSFLLQAGANVLTEEKIICANSDYGHRWMRYENIDKIENPKEYRYKYIPVGSVEFVTKFCEKIGFVLPEPITYSFGIKSCMHRSIYETSFKLVRDDFFVKPREKVKLFTGSIKFLLADENIDPETPVWSSAPIAFQDEYRFYVLNRGFARGGYTIAGGARYDTLDLKDDPSVFKAAKHTALAALHRMIRATDETLPSAFTIDVGRFVTRIGRSSMEPIELNDAWAIGRYKGPHTVSPENYIQMLVSRWRQIQFMNMPMNQPSTLGS